MLAVVRKFRTKTPIFEMMGEIPDDVLDFIKKGYAVDIDDNNEYVEITETDLYKETKALMTPGDSIKIYRENFGYSQAKLGEALGGLSRHKISDMENDRRGISKDIAKKLAKIFKMPVDRFI
ncbi:MAG: helix-turn-helix domain-containing protein [SAR324 cluster bacterium]|nr:helix-turn-helix domain-containing protein [SAR324 cluster bacterium]